MNARGEDHTVDLAAITRAASREAGGVPAGLLGGYLPAVLDAASSGRRLLPGSGVLGQFGGGQAAAAAGRVQDRGQVAA